MTEPLRRRKGEGVCKGSREGAETGERASVIFLPPPLSLFFLNSNPSRERHSTLKIGIFTANGPNSRGKGGLINEKPDCAAEIDLSSAARKNMHLLHYARSTILLFHAQRFPCQISDKWPSVSCPTPLNDRSEEVAV